MAPRCFIGLGSNLNQPAETIREAVEVIRGDGIEVVSVSSLFRTAPIGQNAGGEFINAVAELRAEQSPFSILNQLHAVEMRFGRERLVHWGPRTLDLDLLILGNQVVDSPELSLPHPACWYRRFVLQPLCEIAPDVVHPVQGDTVAHLLAAIDRQPLPVSLHGTNAETLPEIERALMNRFRGRVAVAEDRSNAVLTFDMGTGDDRFAELRSTPSRPEFSREPGVVLVPADRDGTQFICETISSSLGLSQ